MTVGIGYADYSLIGYHLMRSHIADESAIPLVLCARHGGECCRSFGLRKMVRQARDRGPDGGVVLAAASLPLCFLGGFSMALAGMVAWGAGMGAIDAVLRAGISKLVSMNKRGAAFGVFNAAYGAAWFVGSVIMGRLYDGVGALALVIFGVAAQAVSILVFVWFRRRTEAI